MKIQIAILIALTVFLFGHAPLSAIDVTPSKGPYKVGQTLYFSGTSGIWDSPYVNPRILFGDGTVSWDISHSVSVPHRYRSAGTYTLALMGTGTLAYLAPELLVLTIIDTRTITYTPAIPLVGQAITFTANEFATPANIRWEFGDGAVSAKTSGHNATYQTTHTYSKPGTYTISAYDWDGDLDVAPISITLTIGEPARALTTDRRSPREDVLVTLTANNFVSSVIDWNFGDGQQITGGPIQTHRFMQSGLITISALDRGYAKTPVTTQVTVRPENRTISSSSPEVNLNTPVVFTASNFRGQGVWWDFGDGTQIIGYHQENHTYSIPGIYTVTARDERGRSQRTFTTGVTVKGITDEVSLHRAELRFDNGRAYRIVPRNSAHLQAELQMKMEGTGLVTGIWMLDGQPFKTFSQLARDGDVTLIRSGLTPPLPTLVPGLHRLTVNLTRPQMAALPEIAYYVEPISAQIEQMEPADGTTLSEAVIPTFTWAPVRGTSYYEIAFSDTLYDFLFKPDLIRWQTLRLGQSHTPDPTLWSTLTRNRPIFWQIRALDSAGQLISQSEPRALEIRLNPAQISLDKITDIQGKRVSLPISPLPPHLMISGTITYPGEGKFLMLRVFADEKMVNQLMFRDLSPGQALPFTTSVPTSGIRKVTLQVLKPSTPAIIVGVHHLDLRRR